MSKIDIVYASHMWINGKTVKEIGERFGLKRTSASDFIRRHKDRFPDRAPIVGVVGALNPDEVAIAARMWADGRSQGQIGERFNLSRSTIAGIMNRKREMFPERYGNLMKLHKSAKSIEDIPVEHRTKMSAVMLQRLFNAPQEPSKPPHEYDASRLPGFTLWELEKDQCKWPLLDTGKGQEHKFCGAMKDGKSYCTAHRLRSTKGVANLSEMA